MWYTPDNSHRVMQTFKREDFQVLECCSLLFVIDNMMFMCHYQLRTFFHEYHPPERLHVIIAILNYRLFMDLFIYCEDCTWAY